MTDTVLVRYGAIGEVARFRVDAHTPLARNQRVVVRTVRGVEIGTLLQPVDPPAGQNGHSTTEDEPALLRAAGPDDEQAIHEQQAKRDAEFAAWQARIADWKVDLQLIDLEWTLDGEKLILYVLNDRGPACTTLALHAAAAGLGVIEVQPVDADGPVQLQAAGGGCGTGGGGCCH